MFTVTNAGGYMTKTNWDKLAKKQFKKMPIEFQEDWKDLRQKVHKT